MDILFFWPLVFLCLFFFKNAGILLSCSSVLQNFKSDLRFSLSGLHHSTHLIFCTAFDVSIPSQCIRLLHFHCQNISSVQCKPNIECSITLGCYFIAFPLKLFVCICERSPYPWVTRSSEHSWVLLSLDLLEEQVQERWDHGKST